MTFEIDGDVADVLERVRLVVERAGWRVLQESPNGSIGLLPTGSDGSKHEHAWLLATPNGEGVALTVWLPEVGTAASCAALEGALTELVGNGDETGERALVRRLRRIEGQIRGLQRMIENHRECEAILTQFAAVTSALKQTAAHLVSAHLAQCVRDAVDHGAQMDEINQRLLSVLF